MCQVIQVNEIRDEESAAPNGALVKSERQWQRTKSVFVAKKWRNWFKSSICFSFRLLLFPWFVHYKNTDKDQKSKGLLSRSKGLLFVFFPLGFGCITEHAKFRIVCLDTDVLNTALVAIHNIRCNPLPDLIENRWVVALFFFVFLARRIVPPSMYSVNIFYLCLFCFFNFPRTWRLAAYRQFTWWAHGALRKKNRRVIPACVVKPFDTSFPMKLDNMPGSRKQNSS